MKPNLCKVILLLTSFWIGTALDSLAQHYPMRHFGTESGLPKSMVAGITQDEEGFLWVGTSGGVCRFDGTSFTRLETKPPVEYFYAKSFLRDSKGDFWLGMQENGLVRIHREQSYHFGPKDGLPDNTAWAVLDDRKGNVWVGTSKGLAVLRSEDRERGNFLFQRTFAPQLSALEVYRVVEDAEGRIWIATDGGLFLSQDGQIVRHWPQAGRGRCLVRHPDGFVLVQMPEGLFRSEGDSLVAFYRDPRLKKFRMTDLAFSGETTYIATYGQGLLKLEGRNLEIIREKNGLITEYLHSLLVDREGSLWIGSIQGLSQLYEAAFVNYTKEDGLIANSVHTLAEDAMGNIYLGGDHGLSVVAVDTILTLVHSAEKLPLRRIISMAPVDHGMAIIARTEDGAKFRVFLRGAQVSATAISRAESGASGLRMELQDRLGNRWLSTPDSGIYCTTSSGTRFHWTTASGLPTNNIFEIGEDISGAIWCSTIGKGLLRFRHWTFDHFTTAHGLPSDHVEDIFVHPITKELWFTTNNGPARWRGENARPPFETFPDVEKLRSRDFGGVAADQNGNMWFTTSAGVVRYDRKTFEMFTHEHGLVGPTALGLLVDKKGHVWVGGPRGASKIFPERLQSRVEPPTAILTRIETEVSPITGAHNIELSYRQNDLRFVFLGLNLRYPRGILYSYRLEGLDDAWSAFTPQNEVRFPSLPPGRFRLQVRAMNIRDAVSQRPAEFAFTILPPIWQRWWFLLSSAVILFVGGWVFYHWRVSQLLAVERMRTRIAADLHDDIASSLASVALYSEVIQRQLQNVSGDVRALLGRIRELSREAMENIGTIVWAVDPRRDQLSEVMHYFQRHAAQLCTASGISFVSHLPEKMRPLLLSPEKRRTIYLILKEGLNNILRHAQASMVEFTCTLHERTLHLRLRDNGHGFDIAVAGGSGRGLTNMRTRAEAIGADMDIESQSGVGTTLRLKVRMT